MTCRALSIVVALVLAGGAGLRGQDQDRTPDGIEPHGAYDLCRKLASEEFGGRLTGDAGYTAAIHWAADRFRQWGLRPASETDGYLQGFPVEVTVVEEAEMVLTTPGGTETKLAVGQDFLPLLFTDSGEHTGGLVFAGWGISAPDLGYDDYAGLEVGGHFVLCFRGTPDPSDPRYQPHDEHRTRMKTAATKGARGLIYIYDEPIASPNGDWQRGFLPAMIGQRTADAILKEKSLEAKTLRADLGRYRRPLSFATGSRLAYRVRSRHEPAAAGYNAIGIIPGADSALAGESVIVGAHADHCGTHLGLQFPGAEDNASGTAVAMEIGRALAARTPRPRRTVAIVLFGAEESGLQGSEFFAAHPPAALSRPVAMLNFDMVGTGDGAHCGHSREPAGLKTVLEAADAAVKTLRSTSVIERVGVRSSDFAPFFQRGIPVLSFSSNGPHLAYHQPGDSIYRINPTMLADMARLGLRVAGRLADAPAGE